LFVFGYVS